MAARVSHVEAARSAVEQTRVGGAGGGAAVAGSRARSAPWWSAEERGPRRHHADASAGFAGRDGRLAVAVADGVGDSEHAARIARMAADLTVRNAVLDGRADLAVLSARDVLLGAGPTMPGDAALVVALGPDPRHGDGTWTVAWVGDCRALSWDGARLHPLTRDRTVGAEMREAGAIAAPHLDHVLTTSLRTVRGATEIGLTAVRDPLALILTSDGVHKALAPARLTGLVGHLSPRTLARGIVDAATDAGTRDNATALVVPVGGPPPVPQQRGR